ncbi:MAG: Fe-S cluster biosynthesis and repair protein YggX [Gammaproteobacteria bacterium]|jgi:Fe-S cluster biosynthesis and repair protein YggX
MSNLVLCSVLKREAPGLAKPPYPGELGERIHANVSDEGWKQWLERLVLIINENQISTADPKHITFIEEQMLGFLFGEGDSGAGSAPSGFQRSKK